MLRSFPWLAPPVLFAAMSCGGVTSSGTTGSGGAAGAGGTTGTGGSGGQSVDASGPCTAGSVTFHMTAASGNNSDYCIGRSCTFEWLSITDTSGVTLPAGQPLDLSLGCFSACDDCRVVGCPGLCPAPQPMKPEGERLTWDGTFYQSSTCGAQITCELRQCALPGKYSVKMCATRSGVDSGQPFACSGVSMPETCTTLDFDYPSADVVEGVIK